MTRDEVGDGSSKRESVRQGRIFCIKTQTGNTAMKFQPSNPPKAQQSSNAKLPDFLGGMHARLNVHLHESGSIPHMSSEAGDVLTSFVFFSHVGHGR